MSKTCYFIFNDDCFDRAKQASSIAHTKRQYNKTLYEMNRAVEELDRYDDFDALKITPDKYRQHDMSGEYGIPFDGAKHTNNSVIFKHQSAAAIAFLKDLRGFGLLADVVGSGKTFEAALILSELAIRGKINSMLLVVPDQVYDGWINVLEKQFGMGKGTLFQADSSFRNNGDFVNAGITFDAQNRPSKPIIVKTEDFVKWDNGLASYLFDVIVVDEAHHLCKEDGAYAKAMKLLSMMMQTKKLANVTYCLLLSATPHSGNLAHMFRLWYFIRCRGGRPSDFEGDENNRSEEYKKEKAYYTEHICRGATTVMEFIKRVKKSELLLNYSEQFEQYLIDEGTSLRELKTRPEGEQQMRVDEFLRLEEEENIEINKKVMRAVANAYHNGVLRSIMIRQPSTELVKRKKTLVNYLYYPALPMTKVTIENYSGAKLSVSLKDMHKPVASITPVDNAGRPCGDAMKLEDYVRDGCGDAMEPHRFQAYLLSAIFKETADESKFEKKNFKIYYTEQMTLADDRDTHCELRPMDPNQDSFDAKFADAKEILLRHAKEKVLVFFDYELKKKDVRSDRFLQELEKIPELASRIVIGSSFNREKTLNEFEKKDNAILVIKDASFTEGANLQSGNVIINFQVTPDPLAMDQRIGRIFRLGQKHDVTIYSLAEMNRLEGFALMYFVRIGLMSSNSGDATIIAGSNNERMVAIRCDRCGRVMLLPQEDYEFRKKNNDLYCDVSDECRSNDPRGTVMKEISVYDFKCDQCSAAFVRSVSEDESGYMCVANNNTFRSVMCNHGEKGDRRVYCRKICAMAHCNRLTPATCPAVAAYLKDRSIGDQDIYTICSRCPRQDRCPEKCRPYVGTNGISACSTCDMASCRPKPHVIEFDDHWEASCPVCKQNRRNGKLRPVVARTFAAYLRASWDFNHDGGQGFCENLTKEAGKVTDIKTVLDADKMSEDNENGIQ